MWKFKLLIAAFVVLVIGGIAWYFISPTPKPKPQGKPKKKADGTTTADILSPVSNDQVYQQDMTYQDQTNQNQVNTDVNTNVLENPNMDPGTIDWGTVGNIFANVGSGG